MIPTRNDFARVFSGLFENETAAAGLLAEAHCPKGYFRSFDSMKIIEWWGHVYDEIAKGVIENVDVEKIISTAHRMNPGNKTLVKWHGNTKQKKKTSKSEAIRITLPGGMSLDDIIEAAEMFRNVEREIGKQILLDIAEPGSHRLHFSIPDATEEEAEQAVSIFRSILQSRGIQGEVQREPHTFRDYYADPLTIEGPDGQRFALERIRASTLVGDVARSVMNDYQANTGRWGTGQGGRQQAVVNLMNDAGQPVRLDPRQTLHDAGVRPGAVLQVHPERTAGAIHPAMREEALARVRVQVLDYAATHPGFEFTANSPVAPTEYIFHFAIPGFRPPSGPGAPPGRINRHSVLVYLPPDFPILAPEAWWQSEIFHPNIDRKTGAVCLGALQKNYKPGLEFGELCQMLVDIAGYHLYSPEPGNNLDAEAALWALSEAGQQAIEAVGGVPVVARVATQNDTPQSRFRLRRLE